jgi:CubicO group peptidase (beta-lactamase class C family)
VEDGKLSLEDSIARFFSEAPAAWRPITLRHLLTHTSGIPDYIDGTLDLRKDFTEEEFVGRTFAMTLEFPAGRRWNYSNTGYVLLGFIVRRASGKFYGDLLRERVFTPLGMSSARVISEEDIVEHRAAGYRIVKEQLKNQPWVAPTLNTTADGALYLSADDLIRWDRAVRERALLKPSSWEAILTPVRLTSGKPFPYGFGWGLPDGPGPARIGHTGHTWGFTTAYVHLLEEDLTVLMLCNLDGVDETQITRRVAGVIVPAILTRRSPQPDPDPALAQRVLELIRQSATGTLRAEDFEWLRAGALAYMNKQYKVQLQGMSSFDRLSLLEGREVGDDLHVEYRARSGNKTFIATAEVSPSGRFTFFDVRPEIAD